MEVRQLAAFVELSSVLHFGRAAETLCLTQSALSQRIKGLESELKTQLFIRSARGVSLTESGRVLRPYAERILQEEDEARLAVSRAGALLGGRLRIGYHSGDPVEIAQLIQRFRTASGDVRIETTRDQARDNARRVRSGDLELAFVRVPMAGLGDLKVIVVKEEPYVVALPRTHPLVGKGRLALANTRGQPWVLFPRDHNPAQFDYMVSTIRSATGAPVDIRIEEPTGDAMVASAVAAGMLTILSLSQARNLRTEEATFLEIEGDPLIARLAMISCPDPGVIVEKFIETILAARPR